MKTLMYLMLGILVIPSLTLLISGCSRQGICVRQTDGDFQSSFCSRGYESALGYRGGSLPAYRIVIELRPLSESQRTEFLEGFQ